MRNSMMIGSSVIALSALAAPRILPTACDGATVTGRTTTLEIVLERFKRHDHPPIWRFSEATLKGIPGVHEEIRPAWIEHYLWPPLKGIRPLDVPLWMWLAFPLTLVIVLSPARLLSRILFAVLRPLVFRLTGEHTTDPLAQTIAPIRMLALGVVTSAWLTITSLPLLARVDLNRVALALGVIGLAWLLMRFADFATQLVVAPLRRLEQPGDVAIAQLAARLGKIAIILTGALTLLYQFDVDLTTALAGLGVGGLAIAFATEKTLENLFGGPARS